MRTLDDYTPKPKKQWIAEREHPESMHPNKNILSGGKENRLLNFALKSWEKDHGSTGYRCIKDSTGVTGYYIDGRYILTAKRINDGWIVSFSKHLIEIIWREKAHPDPKQHYKLVLWLQEGDRFYEFDIDEIEARRKKEDEEEDKEKRYTFDKPYNGQMMVNCDIGIGVRHSCKKCS